MVHYTLGREIVLEDARDAGPCVIIRAVTDTSLLGAALFEDLGAAKYALQVFLNINGKMDRNSGGTKILQAWRGSRNV